MNIHWVSVKCLCRVSLPGTHKISLGAFDYLWASSPMNHFFFKVDPWAVGQGCCHRRREWTLYLVFWRGLSGPKRSECCCLPTGGEPRSCFQELEVCGKETSSLTKTFEVTMWWILGDGFLWLRNDIHIHINSIKIDYSNTKRLRWKKAIIISNFKWISTRKIAVKFF